MAVTLRKILTRLLAYLLLAIVVSVLLSTVRFFMSTPWKDDCVPAYVGQLRQHGQPWWTNETTGTTYEFEDWLTHIEYGRPDYLSEFETSRVNGCFRNTGNPFKDYVNTAYCITSYYLSPLWKP